MGLVALALLKNHTQNIASEWGARYCTWLHNVSMPSTEVHVQVYRLLHPTPIFSPIILPHHNCQLMPHFHHPPDTPLRYACGSSGLRAAPPPRPSCQYPPPPSLPAYLPPPAPTAPPRASFDR